MLDQLQMRCVNTLGFLLAYLTTRCHLQWLCYSMGQELGVGMDAKGRGRKKTDNVYTYFSKKT